MKKTALYQQHLKHNAKIIDFFGWALPIQYKSIIDEHLAVRNDKAIFDCSHMGQLFIEGKDALLAINYLICSNIKKITIGKAVYSALLTNQGTFLDDIIVYYISENKFLLVVNASNIEKNFNWIKQVLGDKDFDSKVVNASDSFSLLAIQGKKISEILNDFLDINYNEMSSFSFTVKNFLKQDIFICKTGYTGEDGIEIICPNSVAEELFDYFTNLGVIPCGLGARDSLRLEKRYSLYGNEINEEINPFEANLKWILDLEKDEFLGKQALLNIQNNNLIGKKLVAFILEKGLLARSKDLIIDEQNNTIGEVTSGAFSPCINKGIGMAYVPISYNQEKLIIKTKRKELVATIYKKRSFV